MCCICGSRSVKGIIEVNSPVAAVAEVALNHFAEVADTEDSAGEALRTQQFELVRQKWFAGDWQEHLGNSFGQWPQPSRQPPGENRDWQRNRTGAHTPQSNSSR